MCVCVCVCVCSARVCVRACVCVCVCAWVSVVGLGEIKIYRYDVSTYEGYIANIAHTPFEIQLVTIAASFELWVIIVIAGMVTVVVVGVVIDLSIDTLVMSAPLEGLSCGSTFDCRPTAALNCDHFLQAWIPSYHVCCNFVLPAPPQFLNQEPPRPQQLILPDFAMVPHLLHIADAIVVVSVSVFMRIGEKHKQKANS